jgi:hypothetical protein
MDSRSFIEILRTINCMNFTEFVDIYGQNLAKHICGKRHEMGIKFVFELDEENWSLLYALAVDKIERRKEATNG